MMVIDEEALPMQQKLGYNFLNLPRFTADTFHQLWQTIFQKSKIHCFIFSNFINYKVDRFSHRSENCRLTYTRDSISRVSRVTRAVERALGVGAVGVRVTVVGVSCAFVNIYNRRTMRKWIIS